MSKKYDATEKHFQKKEIQYRKYMKSCQKWVRELQDENGQLKDEIANLEYIIAQKDEQIERLSELAEVPKRDIPNLVQSHKDRMETAKNLKFMTALCQNFFGRY